LILAACSIIATIGRDSWRVPVIAIPIIGLIAFGCFQLIPLWRPNKADLSGYEAITANPFETKRFVVKMLVVVAMLTMLSRHGATRRRATILMQAVSIIGAGSALFALLRLSPIGSAHQLALAEGFGQFANRNHFAMLMEMSIGPTSALVYLATTRVVRVLSCAGLLLMATALLSANSRGGFISFLVQCTLLLWIVVKAVGVKFLATASATSAFWRQRLSSRRITVLHSTLLLLLFAMALTGLVAFAGEQLTQRLETIPAELKPQTSESQTAGPRRLEIWGATWQLIKAHPFVGSGLGAYGTAISGHFRPVNEWRPEQAHNEYLELVAGGGIAAAVLGCSFIALIWRELKRRLSEDTFRQAVCLGGAVGLAGVAVHSFVDFGLHVTANMLVCTALITLVTVKFRPALPRNCVAKFK
jgi:O-antigen ligase